MEKTFKRGIAIGIIVGIISSVAFGSVAYYATDGFTNIKREKNRLNLMEMNQKIRQVETVIDDQFLYEKDNSKISDGIYRGILNGLDDVYTEYFSQKEYQELVRSTEGAYCGIGATIEQNIKTKSTKVTEVFKSGPASEGGIKVGDILKKVDDVDIRKIDLSTIVADHILGKKGTEVEITVYRPSIKKTLTFTMTRREVERETVEYNMLDDKIGYIKINEFDTVTTKQFKKAMKQLNTKGAEKLIFDLRGNPGGNLDTVVELVAELVPDGKILYTKEKKGIGETYYTKKGKIYCDGKDAKLFGYPKKDSGQVELPMVVLIDQDSASASEIFAQAMKDYNWATIVGVQSYGKGVVQRAIALEDGSAVKITMAKYFTKSGVSVEGVGVTPDVLTEKAKDEAGTVAQLEKAVEVLKELDK